MISIIWSPYDLKWEQNFDDVGRKGEKFFNFNRNMLISSSNINFRTIKVGVRTGVEKIFILVLDNIFWKNCVFGGSWHPFKKKPSINQSDSSRWHWLVGTKALYSWVFHFCWPLQFWKWITGVADITHRRVFREFPAHPSEKKLRIIHFRLKSTELMHEFFAIWERGTWGE